MGERVKLTGEYSGYITPRLGMHVTHVERRPDRTGEIVRVFPDELEEGPGHRMVKVRWPGPMWTYEASFSLRAALSQSQSDK